MEKERLYKKILNFTIVFAILFVSILSSYNINETITRSMKVFAEETIPEGYTPIYTFEDLYAVRNNLSANYILMNDIDMTDLTAPGGDWDVNGNGWEPIAGISGTMFKGIFDGNGHAIIGMNIHGNVEYSNVGLFGNCHDGMIKNLKLIDVDIDISYDVSSYSLSIGTIVGCSGGMSNCFATGRLVVVHNNNSKDHGYSNVGGLIGTNPSGYIKYCYSNVDIVVSDEKSYVGGITGNNDGVLGALVHCYNTGTINAEKSFRHGAITGNSIGQYVKYCYYLNGTCDGQENVPGACMGLSVGQMKSKAAFTNWDFEKIWIIDNTSNYKYPQLRSCMHDTVTKIEISSMPDKTEYVMGEKLNLNGGKISVYHNYSRIPSGEMDITTEMLGGYDMDKMGRQAINVTVNGCSDSFNILILPPTVSGLLISSAKEESVSIYWNKISGVTGYIVYKYNYSNSIWEKYTTINENRYTDYSENMYSKCGYAVAGYVTVDEEDYIGEKSSVFYSETVPSTTMVTTTATKPITSTTTTFKTTGITTTSTIVTTENGANGDFNGDFNGDGKIDLEDVIAICKILTGSRSTMNMRTSSNSIHGDVSGNGKIDMYDAILISQYIMKNDIYDKNTQSSWQTISSDLIEVENGATAIQIPLYISGDKSNGAFIKITSPEGFTLTNVYDALASDLETGKVIFASGSRYNSGQLSYLTYDIKKNISPGTYPIKIEILAIDNNGKCEYGGIVTGSVTVKDAHIKGDISGNGKVDLYDAIEIAKSLLGKRKFTAEEKKIADFNGDGKINLYDAIAIAKYIIKH